MSRSKPWTPIMVEAAHQQTVQNLRPISEELAEDLDDLSAPRDTGRLLSGLAVVRLRDLVLHAGIFRPPQSQYGRYLNEGTGLFGPKAKRITPKRKGGVLSWVNAGDARVYATSTKGTGKHKGWWDRWVQFRAPAAVRRGWSRRL